jgi:hypothetical protein
MDVKDKNQILQELEKNNICYVLITCSEISEDGKKISAEMNYEGDAFLASYLLQKAQYHIEETDIDLGKNENEVESKVFSFCKVE